MSDASPHIPDAPRLAFPRERRVTRAPELDAVRREGKRVRTEHLEVRALASLRPFVRVGIVVPRHKHSAVDRNRLKRRLREVTRTRLLPTLAAALPGLGGDVVIRATPGAYDASFDALVRQLERVARDVTRILARARPAADETPDAR